MKIEDMKRAKKELGYTNKRIAELSGVPLGTVQKIFSGATGSPREDTINKITAVLRPNRTGSGTAASTGNRYEYSPSYGTLYVGEGALDYDYDYADDWNVKPVHAAPGTWGWGSRQGSYTVEDWEALPDDVRAELIDGVLIYMEAPLTSHQIIVSQVLYTLRDFSQEHHGGCLPLCSPIGVQLDQDDRTMVQPDILVVCDRTRITRKVIFGAPDLVIEVLSPSTRNNDTGLKLKKYWMAGVREYWTIDYDDNEITVYHFESGNPPKTYSFADKVPVGISGGELSVDFSRIAADIEMYLGE